MVKRSLKHALGVHQAKRAQANKIKAADKAAEEAAKRKAISIKSGKQPKRRKKKSQHGSKVYTRPFLRNDTILLVGEGNFSFAHSLLVEPHHHDPDLILATALDSEEECYEKYPDAKGHVDEIRKLARRDSIVVFNVDAGNLEACKAVTGPSANEFQAARWSKIVFNFPHVGAGHKDESRNVLSNQLMLLRFLVSAAPLLTRGAVPAYMSKKSKARKGSAGSSEEEEAEKEEMELEEETRESRGFCMPSHAGSVLITVRNCKPYTLWDIPTLAKRLPSVVGTIASSAPSMGKGFKAPSSEQITRLLELGQGKAYRVWRSFQFSPNQYPVYSHRRTIGWKQGRSTDDNEDILRPGHHHQPGRGQGQDRETEIRTFEFGLVE